MKDLTLFENILEQQIAQNPKNSQKIQQLLEKLEITPRVHTLPVFDIVKARAMGTGKFGIQADFDDAFFVGDMSSIINQHKLFTSSLPRVEPFYAVKCNPDPVVLATLNNQGTGFDCASVGEMQLVLNMNVQPNRIIYANPCKQISHLRFAKKNGIKMVTFDNADELEKIAKVHGDAECVLRILADDSRSLCKLGLKFGATIDSVEALLLLAKSLELNVIGISFHVGSGCFDASAFRDAVVRAKEAFTIGQSLGFEFTMLDIGGGFPGSKSTDLTFKQIVSELQPALDIHFPLKTLRIIAEPGRFYVSAAFVLSVSVTSRRSLPDPENAGKQVQMYYVNDGTYGSFNCIAHDHYQPKAELLVRSGTYVYNQTHNDELITSSIWGPTCDCIDIIGSGLQLPKLNVGDWLVYDNMGAYTMAAASSFNGFKSSAVIYTNSAL